MNRLFAPSAWLIGRLSYRYKLLLNAVAFIVPLTVLALFTLMDLQQDIDAVGRERAALAQQLPALELLVAVQDRHAVFQRSAAGDEAARGELAARRAAVDQGLASLRQQLDSAALPAAPAWTDFAARWQELREASPDDSDGLEAHSELTRLTRSAMAQTLESGGLRADSDATVALLAAALAERLPLLVENIGLARDVGVGAIIRQRLKGTLRSKLQLVRGSLDPLVGLSVDDIGKAVAQRPELAGAVEAPATALGTAHLPLQEALTTKVLDTTDYDMAPADYAARGDSAIDAVLTLARAAAPAAATLLAEREASLRLKRDLSAAGICAVLLLLAYGFIGAYQSIMQSIGSLHRAAAAMAGGDLRARAEPASRDELAAVAGDFNRMADNFAGIIRNASDAADELTQAAAHVGGMSRQIGDASARQSATAGSAAAAVRELTGSIRQVAEHAEETSRVAGDADLGAKHGEAEAHTTASEMQRIASGVQQAVSVIQSLEQRSREIDAIVHTIREIAEQTNLLALNAAIEAARAGETGRGFAVVADEVRKLAERTRLSTQEIGATIGAIQADIALAASEMNASGEQVAGSAQLAASLAATLGRIRLSVGSSATHVHGIVAEAAGQATTSDSIATKVEEIARMSDDNHAAIAAAVDAARVLGQLAAQLRESVAGLQT
ncbi:methyl-accepting chemotaxis protein [Rhodocyclus tenuis]|uniref:methyl-accepting chemotaxis protein n=1 Tax=Rhodocyclus tenuis TaxID=1066 RepID=UPI001902DDB9|nr:methyl-accepting chemotaxis protein [Rhodocyclus tenuis]MBK1681750.1 hypothetical protein [Rhodocyclus tenuis]